MPSLIPHLEGQTYWRSLRERALEPRVVASLEQEFAGYDPAQMPAMSRRGFLQIMAAAMSLAGLTLTGCRRWPERELVPHGSQPEGTMPGEAMHYATLFELGGAASGVLARSYDGRPIKIEGNTLHPFSLGAADAMAQASVLELYDPDRSRGPCEQSQERSWDQFRAFAAVQFGAYRQNGGDGLAVLSRPTSSPTQHRLREQFLRVFPKAQWHAYQPIHRDHEVEGSRLAFGRALRPQYHLDRAKVIACFSADLLGLHPAHQRLARQWSARRVPGDGHAMNRLYAAESAFTLTGSVADHRLPVSPTRVAVLLSAVAAGLGVTASSPASLTGDETLWVEQLIADLRAAPGASLIAVGWDQPAPVHALAHALNAHQGNIGTALAYTSESETYQFDCMTSIRRLDASMKSGRVTTLLILDGNPVYDAPAELAFDPAGTFDRPVTSIHLSTYRDETSARCAWHVPLAHYLECWGDGRAWDGAYAVQQPLIEPLFGGKSAIELLAMLLGQESDGAELVRATARSLIEGEFDAGWKRLLHDGVLEGSAWPPVEPGSPSQTVAAFTASTPAGKRGGMELLFVPSASVYDGRFAGNGWLQELPDPLTKLTWDNAALLSVDDAEAMGMTTGDLIHIETVQGQALAIAAYVMPGVPAGTVVLPLGYGRSAGGRIGRNTGFNTFALRTAAESYIATDANVTKLGRRYALSMTQDHHLIDAVGMWGREKRVGAQGKSGYLIRESSAKEYQRDPRTFQGHVVGDRQLFDPPAQFNEPHAWAMAIDLNRCIGCSACVVSCQAENNIPIVGKDQVANHREMQWLRVDRYFKGSTRNPDVVYAPVACGHCETAPCEQVCPVAATVHDSEGLNTMVYNRCIGTRYCSNNCPLKVRRFNYFDFHVKDPKGKAAPWLGAPDREQDQIDPVKRMAMNPEVTVRMRGVMEKCTYCVQRLQAAKARAKVEHAQGLRADAIVRDGECPTACEAACPTQAIIFGDLNDPTSRVAQAQRDGRAYVMLENLNLRQRTRYLAKLRNPHDATA